MLWQKNGTLSSPDDIAPHADDTAARSCFLERTVRIELRQASLSPQMPALGRWSGRRRIGSGSNKPLQTVMRMFLRINDLQMFPNVSNEVVRRAVTRARIGGFTGPIHQQNNPAGPECIENAVRA